LSDTTDVIVLGVGTSGEDVALRLMDAGLEVVGIEPNLIGGECPFWACIPSKWLLRTAQLLQEARRADGLVGHVQVEPDWSLVAADLRAEVTGDWTDGSGVARFEARGGRHVRGYGRLVARDTVEVDGEMITARRGIVIATGSRPAIPPIPGIDDIGYWTTHDAIQVEELPGSLMILGGGAVGCELGQVFARFGVDVTIVEGQDRLLPGEEPEASLAIANALEAEGVTLHLGRMVQSLHRRGSQAVATLGDGTEVFSERVLVATGRRATVPEIAVDGIDTSAGVIAVDERLRATEGVWAMGDVTGKGMLTHVAMYQASKIVADILGQDPAPADYRAMPRATFTDPEVGSVGLTEGAAREEGRNVSVVVKQLPATFRGWLHRTGNAGLLKLVVDTDGGVLVGATAVGPRGGEMLGLFTTAIRSNVPVRELVDMIYPFPTFVGGIGEALGAYGRGLVTVLDPGSAPMFTDDTSWP
jgi:pyruvate/2-oxoglutarate dehydrogenase complex dihydrolipoamide dehydrogenase (E3) component